MFEVQAQDTIRTRNQEVLVGSISEINEDFIVYTRYDQPDGPIRKLSLDQISEIRYRNGTKETFRLVEVKQPEPIKNPNSDWEPGTINNTGRTVIIRRKGPDLRINPGERFPSENGSSNRFFNNGFYIDGMIGLGDISFVKNGVNNNTTISDQNLSFGVRFGSKFYFGSKEKYRFGINLTWASLTGTISESGYNHVFFSPANFGPAFVYKFKEQIGLEVNSSVGMAISNIYQNDLGIRYGIDVKWRFNGLAIGIDYNRCDNVFSNNREHANIISLTTGVKF